ncbi:MAG: hypothetical protein ACK5MG_01990 [Bacteroidales bacterium]
MTEQERAVIERLKGKLFALFKVVDTLSNEVRELKNEKTQLQTQLTHMREEYDKTSQKYEASKLAGAMAAGGNKEEAKAKIDKILKEVDRCINMLNT